jgi:hypothetical protein
MDENSLRVALSSLEQQRLKEFQSINVFSTSQQLGLNRIYTYASYSCWSLILCKTGAISAFSSSLKDEKRNKGVKFGRIDKQESNNWYAVI